MQKRRSPILRRKGGSNEFHGTARKRRSIRRRGDGLPRPAFRFFGGDDRRQAPPLSLGLTPVGDVQAHVQEVPARGTGPGSDRSWAAAAEFPRGAGGLGGHPR